MSLSYNVLVSAIGATAISSSRRIRIKIPPGSQIDEDIIMPPPRDEANRRSKKQKTDDVSAVFSSRRIRIKIPPGSQVDKDVIMPPPRSPEPKTDDANRRSKKRKTTEAETDSTHPWGWRSNDPARNHAEKQFTTWERNVRRDGKVNNLSREEAIAFMKGNCFWCNRKHIPGINHVQSIDRIDSSQPVYSMMNCISACPECNSLKLWLDHCEFVRSILRINAEQNLRRLMDLCGIQSVAELDALAALESDGSCLDIQGSQGMSALRKGLDLLMEDASTREILQRKVLGSCYCCGESVAFGLDRFYSHESYIESLRNGRLFSCCTPCNMIKGHNEPRKFLIGIRRIYNNITSVAWVAQERPAHEQWAIDLMSEEFLNQKLKFGHNNRVPIQTEIDGQIIVFPSTGSARTFMLTFAFGEKGLPIESASITQYRSFQLNASPETVRQLLRIADDSAVESDDERMLIKMEAEAARLDKEYSEIKPPSKSTRSHHMSFKNRKISDSDDLDLDDQRSDSSSGVGAKKRLVCKPRTVSVATRVRNLRNHRRMLASKKLRVKSVTDTPRYQNSTKKCCRVSYWEDGEWKQCPLVSAGKTKSEHLCKPHFKICSAADDSDDASWRLPKPKPKKEHKPLSKPKSIDIHEHKFEDLCVKSVTDTPRYKNSNNKCCRVSYWEDDEWKQCPFMTQGKKYEHLCRPHFKICSAADDSEDASWRLLGIHKHKFEDLCVKSVTDTPRYQNSTKKCCRVSYWEDDEWKQCPFATQGKKYEHLCIGHFNICSASDDREDASWRLSK